MSVREGFAGQRLVVVPREQTAHALQSPISRALTVTDAGYFPEARAHGVARPSGIGATVLIVCVSGAGWCEIAHARHEISHGDVMILPAHSPHAYGADSQKPWTLWWLHLVGDHVPQFLSLGGFRADRPVRQLADVFRTVALIEEVVRTLEVDPRSTGQIAASGAAWHLLTLLATTRATQGSTPSAVEAARRRIVEQPSQHFSVSELADMAGMSESHFAAMFRQHVGTPVVKYQTSVRMARARLLLDTTASAISEIAREAGYQDPFYFSRKFTALHGLTPTAYRRQQKG